MTSLMVLDLTSTSICGPVPSELEAVCSIANGCLNYNGLDCRKYR
jgi:hypothetical protein